MEDFSGKFDFVVIYVEEAHATDGWVVPGNPFDIATHRDMADRVRAAQQLTPFVKCCPIYVDNFDNEACSAYGAFPDRLFVIVDGVVEYVGDEGPFGYSIPKLRKALESLQGLSLIHI